MSRPGTVPRATWVPVGAPWTVGSAGPARLAPRHPGVAATAVVQLMRRRDEGDLAAGRPHLRRPAGGLPGQDPAGPARGVARQRRALLPSLVPDQVCDSHRVRGHLVVHEDLSPVPRAGVTS